MFSRAPRFPTEKPSEVPGPNQYKLPEQEGWDAYKKGALEIGKGDRFGKDRVYEGPEDVPSTSEQPRPIKGASAAGKRPESSASGAAGRREEEERVAKYNALRRELDELRKLHEDEKKAHRVEVQQLKSALDSHRKTAGDQQGALRKQLESADAKITESKKSLLAAQGEITELRLKLKGQEREKVSLAEFEKVKRAAETAEATRRERDAKVAELEKLLRAEAKKRAVTEEQVSEMKEKVSGSSQESKTTQSKLKSLEDERSDLAKRLGEALSTISTLQESLEGTHATTQDEVDGLRSLLQDITKMYHHLSSTTVSQRRLEEEQLLRMQTQSRLIKTERRLQDKDAQVQELIAYLRYKAEQQELVLRSLTNAEEEIAFLRSVRNDEHYSSVANDNHFAYTVDLDKQMDTDLIRSELEYTAALAGYQRGWLDTLFAEYKSADNIATSLEAALKLVLERTAEIQGKLQVVEIESDAARKRAKEADEEVGVLRREFERLEGERNRLEVESGKERAGLSEELTESKKRLEEIKKRAEKVDLQLKEKVVTEKALSDDIEGLTDALQDAMRWEHAYKRLHEEVEALVQRNELVEREADHLSQFNAEILGHTNPNQKIHYLDRIRKDLAETKQKLAVSTRQREAVLEDNDTLRTELHAYRSLSESKSKPAGMTRVSRLPLSMSTTNDSGRDSLPNVPEDQTMVLPRKDQMTLDELM